MQQEPQTLPAGTKLTYYGKWCRGRPNRMGSGSGTRPIGQGRHTAEATMAAAGAGAPAAKEMTNR